MFTLLLIVTNQRVIKKRLLTDWKQRKQTTPVFRVINAMDFYAVLQKTPGKVADFWFSAIFWGANAKNRNKLHFAPF